MTGVILLFLVIAPILSFWTLVRGLDPLARLIVSVVAGMVILTTVATVMLAASLWSPGGGLVTVAVVCALLVAAGWIRRAKAPSPVPRDRPPAEPKPVPAAGEAEKEEDDDEWIYAP